MATKKTTKKPATKKKAKEPTVAVLTVRPRTVPANHPVAISWTDADHIGISGAEGTISMGTVEPGGSTTWAAAHAGEYTIKAMKDGAEVGGVVVRVR